MSSVSQLIYVSQSRLASSQELLHIVAGSRERNERCGVTGGLLFTGGYFAQILEGGPAEIEELMASIAQDRRHTRVTVLLTRTRKQRDFTGWTMAFNEYPGAEGILGPLVGATVANVTLEQVEALLTVMYQRTLLGT